VIKLKELIVILDLYKEGLTVSAIAERTGLDRKTVRKYIERGIEAPVYGHASRARASSSPTRLMCASV
jgi:transposase